MSAISRRKFMLSLSSAAMAAPVLAQAPARRKRIALIGTEVRKHSHAQHFIDRLLLGYRWDTGWHRPDVDLVSLYIDQFPEGDLVRNTAAKHGVPIYASIADALTLRGDQLAVDGVVIIGEHGKYPKNDLGQTLYPRYRFFKEVIAVFEKSGRSVPVFNDKHLSTSWKESQEMVDDSKRLGFPFLAGSSLPVTWRLPAVEMPYNTPLKESVCVGYGGMDSYDFHGLETAQCMSERRRGGEVGIQAVTGLRGAAMWEAVAKRPDTKRLVIAALAQSQTLPVEDGYLLEPITFEWAQRVFTEAFGYFIEHRDGFHTTLLMLPIQDFNYAGLHAETDEIIACQMFLPMPGSSAATADFFNPLCHHIERMILENRAPYPVERTLLTSGMTMAGVASLHRKGERVETAEMAVRYTAPEASLFWQR